VSLKQEVQECGLSEVIGANILAAWLRPRGQARGVMVAHALNFFAHNCSFSFIPRTTIEQNIDSLAFAFVPVSYLLFSPLAQV
jgi:hypothetical protein